MSSRIDTYTAKELTIETCLIANSCSQREMARILAGACIFRGHEHWLRTNGGAHVRSEACAIGASRRIWSSKGAHTGSWFTRRGRQWAGASMGREKSCSGSTTSDIIEPCRSKTAQRNSGELPAL